MRDDEKYTNSEEQLLHLQNLLDDPDTTALKAYFSELDILDIARTLESFPAKTRDFLWEYVPDDFIGEVLAEVDEDIRADYIEDLSASDVEEIVKGLDAQEVAEVLDVADEAIKTSVYASLEQEIRAQVENLHAYEDDVVGRYMDPETVNVKQGVSLEAVQRYIRIHHLLDDESQQIMITDKDKRLLGTLTLIDLIKQPQEAVVDDYMDDFFTLNDQMKVSDAAALLRSKELHFVPVCDSDGLLVGQLNAADVLEITQDDADMTLKHMSGVSNEEEVFTPVLRSAKSRGIWLGINLLTAFLAAFVIGQFEAALDQIVALAILMPVVASMGGIAGSQTLTVVIRGLALGQLAGNNIKWLYNKEMWVGMSNGLVWALVVGLISHLWFGDAMITLVITLAIFINMSLANLSGVLIPMVLKKLQIDPALSGAVILTTVTDVVGFLSFLGLATLIIL
ncbi:MULTISPECIES: magnesium transporter [Halomonadaceae]|jgi:magnesium transporter|uniref:Magnesium transporter MgtE n=2 Tax=Vreelandella titanicae TaxID=664683 RepID=L9UC64_9GAMM|nr:MULTISPECIES: magnesium transporter [Halomonas]ELY22540.1 Divalent cation transporter [Halomonas titanicae BH1]NVE88736.1 magnesium transporter [Halomonas titanicae]QKS25622.1 Magnesium transporter MgtE [Halomonas titanicae]CDG53181.1 Magnesium transporter mgtE [Halomonas sp. A3H3]